MPSDTESINDSDIILQSDTLAILNEFLTQTNDESNEIVPENWQVCNL